MNQETKTPEEKDIILPEYNQDPDPLPEPEPEPGTSGEPEAPDGPSAETEASERGWMPKDDYVASGKDANTHVGANEFLRRGELFEKISDQKRQLSDQTGRLNVIEQQYADLKTTIDLFDEKQARGELNDIKRRRDEAYSEGDEEKYQELDSQLLEQSKEAAKPEPVAQPQAGQPDRDWTHWLEKPTNAWYANDQGMTGYAQNVIAGILEKSPYIDTQSLTDGIDNAMKEKYPQQFGISREVRKAPSVASGQRHGQGKPLRRSWDSLDAMTKKVASEFTDGPGAIMTREEYLKQL